MDMTEEMFLLAHRPDGRLVRLGTRAGVAYTMTAIVELTERGRLAIEEGKQPRLHVVDPEPTNDSVLDHTLGRIVAKRDGERLARCIIDKHADPHDRIVERLTSHGVIDSRSGGLASLGARIYPLRNLNAREEVVARLAEALTRNEPISAHDATMLAALNGVGFASRVLGERTQLSRTELARRIKQAARDAPGGDAVRQAMASMAAVSAAAATT